VTEADAAARAALAANAPLIERLARVNAPVDGAMGPGMIAVAALGASFALPVGDVIDVQAETARLEKAAAKTEKGCGRAARASGQSEIRRACRAGGDRGNPRQAGRAGG
jgi:valyl-tRNA synthetase